MAPTHGSIYRIYVSHPFFLGFHNESATCSELQDSSDDFRKAWIVNNAGEEDGRVFWTMRNVKLGTYLQLAKVGNDITLGMDERAVSERKGMLQEWYMDEDEEQKECYRIQCRANKRLLVHGTNSQSNVTTTVQAPTSGHVWKFDPISRPGEIIREIMKTNPNLPNVAVEYLSSDSDYLVLPNAVRQEIWQQSGLGMSNLGWRQQIFDCDDFALVAKAEVAKWAAQNLRAEGFSILFGITFGKNPNGAQHAFNWYLTQDLQRVVFFEPQKGIESDSGWGFHGTAGLF